MEQNASPAILEQLDSFDPAVRLAAVRELARQMAEGGLTPPTPQAISNVHLHTFHSYSSEGYSPSRIVWEGRRRGLAVVGTADFDVLDALPETLAAGRSLGIRTTVSMETRTYSSTYFDREISSPGEPGVFYVLGMGFTRTPEPTGEVGRFVAGLKTQSRARNIAMLQKVNPALEPVQLDYDDDVLPLTPSGNPTERHLCRAYSEKARKTFPDDSALATYWRQALQLDEDAAAAIIHDEGKLQNTIRAKMMKRGGPGYTQPDSGSFPAIREVFAMVQAAGAIPCLAWLDGLSQGESDPNELLDDAMSWGARIVNIIPDRNWNIPDPELKRRKLAALDQFIKAAQRRHLPVVVGTEMNGPGQKFVDDFTAPELVPYVDGFMDGAYLLYGHTVLEAAARMGLMSDWAASAFKNDPAGANAFYTEVGRLACPSCPPEASDIPADATPEGIRNILQSRKG